MADALSLPALHDGPLAELRVALLEAGYADAFLGECEAIAPRMLDAIRLPAVHWWLRRDPRPAALIARLWAYGDVVDDGALARVFDAGLRSSLQRVGALREASGGFRGGLRLVPFCGLWIASDEMHGEDPVMGPGATTQLLAGAIGPGAGRVLDVGSGAGSLALVAAGEIPKVVVAPGAAATGAKKAAPKTSSAPTASSAGAATASPKTKPPTKPPTKPKA